MATTWMSNLAENPLMISKVAEILGKKEPGKNVFAQSILPPAFSFSYTGVIFSCGKSMGPLFFAALQAVAH